MKFNPKEAWQIVSFIAGEDTTHHASPTIMQIRLPNGEMATTNAENASLFGPHFDRVFNNHIPIYFTRLDNINKIDVMEELDPPISWEEIKKPTTKLPN